MRLDSSSSLNEEDNDINMTPMLDVVFILLIFFIVTTSFVREAGIEVDRPTASSATNKNDISVVIAIADDDSVWLDGKPIDQRSVRDHVEHMLLDTSGNVVVQADKKASTGVLVSVMDQAKLAGATKVSLAAETE
ncbi:MAG: biopolymer transporter ExbD [Kangiellaceae bacterium]|jgi:biopolymer transport protein ExbD|nr:biopolymer transporter ExbD [Kangiellaceae bacterium]|tara:strand:+ start:793 stop:1197 length:405 start_codon:yes stop_codon:yes gene_type:complete